MTWLITLISALMLLEPFLTDELPPVVVQPSPEAVQDPPAAPEKAHSATGTASWYCGHGSACAAGYAGGLYAAAGPALRTPGWRGRLVTVRAVGTVRTVVVRLIDWCACPRRAIDLYSDAFGRLAPLSRGVLKVTVSW